MSKSSRQRGFTVRGDALRELRQAHDWTQEEAAHRAGVSDKLVRKAEAGGRIDAASLAALATLYSSPTHPLRPEDLLVASGRDQVDIRQTKSTANVLVEWLNGIWNERNLATVERLAAPGLSFHCEAGQLASAAAVRDRIERIWSSFDEFQLSIDRVTNSGGQSVCRWHLAMRQTGVWLGSEPNGRRMATLGTTTARIEAGKIVECWEFWAPQAAYRELSQVAGESNG